VIAGERTDEPVCELSADRGLEPVFRARAPLRQPWEARTVVEEAADGSSVDGRRLVHGPLLIGARHRRSDPWRE
jgi:hypothetical protein